MPLKSHPGNLVYGTEIYPDPEARKQGESSFFIFNFNFSKSIYMCVYIYSIIIYNILHYMLYIIYVIYIYGELLMGFYFNT